MNEKMLLEWLLKNEQMRGPRSRFSRRKGAGWAPAMEREAARWLKANPGFRALITRVESDRLARLDESFERWLAQQAKR